MSTTDGRIEHVEMKSVPGQPDSETVAILRFTPFMRHAIVANALAAPTVKFGDDGVSALDAANVLKTMAEKVGTGDMTQVSDALLSQAVMLDTTTTELMRRAWQNAGEYPEAFHRYMSLALKAQVQSRSTLEALARLHQPREQVVRHVHVYEGGQAVVAEQLHMHGPGVENAGITDQSYTARATGVGECTSLPSPDPLRDGMPIPSREGPEAVPHARRDKSRRSTRQPKRAQARAANG